MGQGETRLIHAAFRSLYFLVRAVVRVVRESIQVLAKRFHKKDHCPLAVVRLLDSDDGSVRKLLSSSRHCLTAVVHVIRSRRDTSIGS